MRSLPPHSPCLAADQDTPFSKSEVIVAGADTVRLATDLYLPKGAGLFPCILMRTPYNKNGAKGDAEKFVNQGYAVVIQDSAAPANPMAAFTPFAMSGRTAWRRSRGFAANHGAMASSPAGAAAMSAIRSGSSPTS